MRLKKEQLSPEQIDASQKLKTTGKLLHGIMGSGKTITVATTITELLDEGKLKKAIILSTPEICRQIWRQQFNEWEHTHHIKIDLLIGGKTDKKLITQGDCQVLLVTFQRATTLRKYSAERYFDGLIIDESTKLTTPGSPTFRAVRYLCQKIPWKISLSGTPLSESMLAAYGQRLLLDQGKTFGTNFQKFKLTYFIPLDYKQYRWQIREDKKEELFRKFKEHEVLLPDTREDELPPLEFKCVKLQAPKKLIDLYRQVQRSRVLPGAKLPVKSRAALNGKLDQLSSGFYYNENQETVWLSAYRMRAVAKELAKLKGGTIIVYNYLAELEILFKSLKHLECAELKEKGALAKWDRKELDVLFMHPRSGSHGLRLEQGGCNLMWFSQQWGNDVAKQVVARAWRRGQTQKVTIISFVCEDFASSRSIDLRKIARIDSKEQLAQEFEKFDASN